MLKNVFLQYTPRRWFQMSPAYYVKEIIERVEGKQLVIEGVKKPSTRSHVLLQPKGDACPVCSTDLEIKHTDVLILSQFVRTDGCMLPRRVTGLCRLQQKRVSKMVAMAQKAGLMASLAPPNSKKDPTKRKEWKKFNTYFDESTIRPPREFSSRVPKIPLPS